MSVLVPRIIVTGDRHATQQIHGQFITSHLVGTISRWFPYGATCTVVHGDCQVLEGGVDSITARLATQLGWTIEAHPARGHPTQDFGGWPDCGPRRNAYMCSLGADLCIGFPGLTSRGTWNCLGEAARHGITSVTIPLPREPTSSV